MRAANNENQPIINNFRVLFAPKYVEVEQKTESILLVAARLNLLIGACTDPSAPIDRYNQSGSATPTLCALVGAQELFIFACQK